MTQNIETRLNQAVSSLEASADRAGTVIDDAVANTIDKNYLGTWQQDITTFNSFNDYAVFNGQSYKPKNQSGIEFPYVAQSANPTQSPDSDFIQPFSDVNSDNLSTHPFVSPSAVEPRNMSQRSQDLVNLFDWTKVDGVNDNTGGIRLAEAFAYSVGRSLYAPDANYIVSDEIRLRVPLIGQSKARTIFEPKNFDSDLVMKTKKWFTSNAYAFAPYEGTEKAVFDLDGVGGVQLMNFSINSGVHVENDEDILLLPNVTGLRAIRENNLIENPASSRTSYSNIEFRGLHTAFDHTGFIINYENLSAFSCKNGVVASEWNNINGDIIMESVKRAFQVYGGYQVKLNSFINESHITCDPNIIIACNAFHIDGLYLEGNPYPNGIFRLGMQSDAGSVPTALIYNYDVQIYGTNVTIPNQSEALIHSDCMQGLKIGGKFAMGYERRLLNRTTNTRDVDIDIHVPYRDWVERQGTHAIGEQPINFFPSPTFKNKSAGTFSYGRAFSGGDGSTYDTQWFDGPDNSVEPIGQHMLKLTTLDGSAQDIAFDIRRKNEWPKYINEGDLITVAVWVYVPRQTYRDGNVDGNGSDMPYLSSQAYGDTNTGGSVIYMPNYDKWCLYFYQYEAPANVNNISIQLRTSNATAMPAGTHLYIGGAFVCVGHDVKSFIKKNLCKPAPAEFGDESQGNLYVKSSGSYDLLPDNIEFTVGDTVTNPTTTGSGQMKNIQCLVEGSIFTISNRSDWSPVDLPPVYELPTIDPNYWSCCWLDNGVLKINNAPS